MKTPGVIKRRPIRNISALGACVLLAACSGDLESDSVGAEEEEFAMATQSVAACAGDDAVYDYNAFAASLAVAVANELGRWDVSSDFEVRNGKLELSSTGTLRCDASSRGCNNIIAMLRLQDDASSSVPNHSPAIYRGKLVDWYQKQKTTLTQLVNQMLTMDKGVYKLQAQHSGKYMAVDGGSLYDNAGVEQRGYSPTGADEWRLILENTTHKFKNVRSGKCLALASDSSADLVRLVQQPCSSTATTQQFYFAQGGDSFAIRTKYEKALDVEGASGADDARLIQYTWTGGKLNQKWKLVPVGTGQHIHPNVVATAMYQLTVKHSQQAIGVQGGLLTDGVQVEQRPYNASDDRFHWYITPVNGQYQFINRRSGKCLALSADTDTARLVQQTCAPVATQIFAFAPTGDGYQVIYSTRGRPLEVSGASTAWEAPITQGSSGDWFGHRMFKLTPLLAGEPHRLTFSHTTNDAQCGELNFWYDVAQPNGSPLRAPADTYVQLIFAGGKTTKTGTDVNPFIAQQVSGNLVAIDPTYGLNQTSSTSTGTCEAACVKVTTSNVTGQCCSCSGWIKKFARSTWNADTYLCK